MRQMNETQPSPQKSGEIEFGSIQLDQSGARFAIHNDLFNVNERQHSLNLQQTESQRSCYKDGV